VRSRVQTWSKVSNIVALTLMIEGITLYDVPHVPVSDTTLTHVITVNYTIFQIIISVDLWSTDTRRIRCVLVSDTRRYPTPMITLDYVIFSNYYQCHASYVDMSVSVWILHCRLTISALSVELRLTTSSY